MRRPPLGALIAGAVLAAAIVLVLGLALGGGGGTGGRTTTAAGPTTSTGSGTTAPQPPPTSPPARPAPSGIVLGLNVNWLFNANLYTSSQIASQLRAVRATGVTVARTDALWEAAEPTPPPGGGTPHWSWAFDDRIAGALAAAGLRWLPILDYTPVWESSVPGTDHAPPRDPSAFAAFAGAFAARYGARGSFWRAQPALARYVPDTFEVWNEPDNPVFWKPSPDPSTYASLYLDARGAIDAVDPSARVIVGGLSHPTSFLPALLHARPDLAGHLDGVAIHPYGANPFVIAAGLRSARATLRALGAGAVPLYVTEFGWTTSPPGVFAWAPATARPGYIAATVTALGRSDCGVAATVLYTWVTPRSNPSDREDWFGIATPQGGPTPDTAAFTRAVGEVQAGAGATSRLCAS